MITVRMMVRVPSERVEITGRREAAKEAAKQTAMMLAMTMSLRAGGMMTARNIP